MSEYINLDANASFGMPESVRSELHASGLAYLNPSSVHTGGQRARHAIEEARESLRALFGLAKDDHVIFTSGASEANSLAIKGALLRAPAGAGTRHAIVSAVEHASVLGAVDGLAPLGYGRHAVRPEAGGSWLPERFAEALRPETRIVSVMLANNETGQVLPCAEIAATVKSLRPDVLVHVDAVQAAGKMSMALEGLQADLVSVSAHKLGGLAGSGALIARSGVALHQLVSGGPQESRFRGGTENVFGIVSLGVVSRLAGAELGARLARMRECRDALRSGLQRELGAAGLVLNRFPGSELTNTLSVRFPGVPADDLVVALDLAGVLASSGAACASGKPEPSHVLLAMGLSDNEARETVRFSTHDRHAPGEIERAVRTIADCVTRARVCASSCVSAH